MADIIQVRRDTASNWSAANPVLADGEFGLETDTKKGKYGDGVTAWNSLSYATISDTGSLIAGTGITLSGTIANRLIGAGDVTINASATGGGTDLIYLSNGYYTNFYTYASDTASLQDTKQAYFVPFTQALFWKNNMNITSIRFVLSSGVANSYLRFGLYELTGVNTLSLVTDYGRILTDGGGFQELTVSGTITKGKMYYFIVKRDDTQGGTVLISGGRNYSYPFTVHSGLATGSSETAALFKTGLTTNIALPASETLPTNGDISSPIPLLYLNLANI